MASENPVDSAAAAAAGGSKEFTPEQVAEHSTRKDLWFTIHDKVYNATNFADEHPGGEEVLVDVGGQDATEAFEDVGHSDEAREILTGLLVGSIKGGSKSAAAGSKAGAGAGGAGAKAGGAPNESSFGLILYAVVFVGGVVAYLAYQYLQQQQAQPLSSSSSSSAPPPPTAQ